MTYSVQAETASRGYHVYKNVNWENVKAGEKVTIEIETNKGSFKINQKRKPPLIEDSEIKLSIIVKK